MLRWFPSISYYDLQIICVGVHLHRTSDCVLLCDVGKCAFSIMLPQCTDAKPPLKFTHLLPLSSKTKLLYYFVEDLSEEK